MKPFSGVQDKGSKNRIFNYRLSIGRRVSENAFELISSVFRVLRKPMLLEQDTATKVTLTIHNFLRKSTPKAIYNPTGTFDTECATTGETLPGVWRQENSSSQGFINIPRMPRRSTVDAQTVRNEFKEYFISREGKLDFK
ncbi:hypothetical protein ANN_14157 [Periplaneta americana]|uniref:Uncharacterized protein n=1 Tax=Periplaneta americana TaxID=6978 RepID=A0ABQ8SW46_PERAM|nr:hypothetical protein ANN_14157 [Periplaneta americana]